MTRPSPPPPDDLDHSAVDSTLQLLADLGDPDADPARRPKHIANVPPLSDRAAITEARTIIARSGVNRSVLWADARRRGPKRKIPILTMLHICAAFQIQDPRRDLIFLDIIGWLEHQLSRQNRERIGLIDDRWNYDLLLDTFHGFITSIDDVDSVHRFDNAGTLVRPRVDGLPSRDVILNSLIGAAIPDGCPSTPFSAIDSTDAETFARLRTSERRVDGDDEYVPDNLKKEKPEKWGLPIDQIPKGPDERFILSADVEARCGYRTVVNGTRSNTFIGWDAHVLVDAGWIGAEFYVQFIRGMVFRPAGSHKGDAGIALIDSLVERFVVDTLCADRGYSYATADRWVRPLAARGIRWVHELHKSQRGERTLLCHDTFTGHVLIDGTIFTKALPENLRSLPAPAWGMPTDERDALIAQYDARARYAFTPNGSARPDGSWQYRGPARVGRVDCINTDPSRRINADAPITRCAKGDHCWCDRNPLIPGDDYLGLRQHLIYGTTAWAEAYGLRNASESTMAEHKNNRGTMRRGSTAIFGTTANAFVFAMRCVAINVALRRRAYGDRVNLRTADPNDVPTVQRLRPRKHTPRHLRRGPKQRPPIRRQATTQLRSRIRATPERRRGSS